MGRLVGWQARIGQLVKRPVRLPHALAGLAVLLVIAVITANSLAPHPGPDPSGSPFPSGTNQLHPTSAPQAWTDLHLAAYDQLADLKPVVTDTSGVALNSAFTLHSRTSTPAATLATGLRVQPTFAFTVAKGATADEVRIVPSKPLAAGVRYRFSLADPTGRTIGTWSYRTGRPLQIVGRIPDDRTTDVPVNTGIEITFDQDGATNVADHFSITPQVAGTFQRVGRTIVFAPTKPLAPSTVYRIAVAPGVGMEGSDEVLETGATWSFETSGPTQTEPYMVWFGLRLLETSPSEPAVIGLDLSYDDGHAPKTIPLQAYRLPSFAAARAAAAKVLADPGWQQLDSSDLVDTSGLTRVVDANLSIDLHADSYFAAVSLPAPLAPGWYLLDIPRTGRDRQAVLQVTNLAAYVMTSTTRTVAWVHDIGTGDAVVGAGLFDPAGTNVGTTDPAGLIDIATPDGLTATYDPDVATSATLATVVTASGERLIVALGSQGSGNAYAANRDGAIGPENPSDRWWLLLSTDRTAYRPTDTVHAWGLIRARDGGSVPASVEIRLRAYDSSDESGPWLGRTTVRPTARGTWTGDLALTDLPYGGYLIDVVASGQLVTSAWISIDDIRKPAYQLEVTTDPTAVIAGDQIHVSTTATYFDGTPAAGLDLRVTPSGGPATVTTALDGTASFALAGATGSEGGFDAMSIGLAPANPEEGQISGGATVFVFPSSIWLTSSAQIDGSTVRIAGLATHVDLAAVRRELLADGFPDDPAGAAYGGRTITISVVEDVPVTRQTGTTYDFIEKRVVPVFETEYRHVPIGTYTTSSAADGTFKLAVDVPDPDNGYTVTMTTKDPQGRRTTEATYATKREVGRDTNGNLRPYLAQAGACGYVHQLVDVGHSVDLTMFNGDGTPSASGQYLFIVASRGIRDVVLQDLPTLQRTLSVADLPDLEVTAIRFGVGGYIVTNEVLVTATPESRALTVTVTGDRDHYAPGQTATVAITVKDPAGSPVAADVVIRGVDEKLFAGNDATDIDALAALLQPVGDGLLQSAVTHQVPVPGLGDGCGDTGGGSRDDFRDSIVFRMIATNASGVGSTTFPLPDDITSWHISATAIDGTLRAGDAATLLPVGLPFFADAILAPEFLAGERPVLRVRSAGEALTGSEQVHYTVSSASLLMAATSADAAASGDASIQLPSLPLGDQAVTIDAVVVGHPELHDRLTRTFHVRASRLGIQTSALVEPALASTVGGAGLTTYVVSDAGRGALLPMLSDLAGGGGARVDRALGADVARRTLVAEFGVDPANLPVASLDMSRWQRNGVALLPYSSPDLELTSLALLVAPELLNRTDADQALATWLADGSPSAERQVIALAGQAALGQDVVDRLDTFDRAKLGVHGALWLALAYLASGDETTARSIERDLLDAHGEGLDQWVRLRVGSTLSDSVEATSLLALVAAGVGDPLATGMLAYLRDNPVSTFLPTLHEMGAVLWLLDRLPREAATFSWTVDGIHHAEAMKPGESRTIVVSTTQRAGLTIEPGSGSISVLASWTATPTAGSLPSSDLVSITRTITPSGDTSRTGIVHVTLNVTFAPQATLGCYDVTDWAPSGLAPLVAGMGWPDETADAGTVIRPWAVDGNRVSWCIDPLDSRRPVLAYAARVVSPGAFSWEPAIIQAAAAPSIGAATSVSGYVIR